MARQILIDIEDESHDKIIADELRDRISQLKNDKRNRENGGSLAYYFSDRDADVVQLSVMIKAFEMVLEEYTV